LVDEIDIISDSKSAIAALASRTVSSQLVLATAKELSKLHSRIKTNLCWIKAHVGHEGNERADIKAKEGTMLTDFRVEPIIPVAKSWVNNKINQYVIDEWTWTWQHTNEARQTKIFFPAPDKRKSTKLLAYDRETFGQIFRWISGHSFHRYHNHLTYPDKFPSSLCRICKEEREETHHLFAHCCGLAHTRMRVLGKSYLEEKFDWTPNELRTMITAIEMQYPEDKPRCGSNQTLTHPR
jgi:hypothetical protein